MCEKEFMNIEKASNLPHWLPHYTKKSKFKKSDVDSSKLRLDCNRMPGTEGQRSVKEQPCYPDVFTKMPVQPTEKKPGQLPEEQLKQFFEQVWIRYYSSYFP